MNKKINYSKELLFNNPNLVAVSNSEQFVFDTDNQFLYLYPLNIIDYIKAYKQNKPIKLVVKNFNSKHCNMIIDFVENKMFNDDSINKCVELEIKFVSDNFETINKLFGYLIEKNIKIVLNFKSIDCITDYSWCLKYANFIKISMEDINGFNKNFKLFKTFKKSYQQLLFAKIYLNKQQIDNYYGFVKKLKSVGFDYVLFSKILLQKDQENVKLDYSVSQKLHELKYKLEDANFKVKLVKDLSTLYYPLFMLDERNSKTCYASKVCNYLINEKLYPCATKQILDDNVLLESDYGKEYIGKKCLDCASIFENDYINEILKHNFKELKFKSRDFFINHVGIGTFKFKQNYDKIQTCFSMGQNLIDCNLAYNNGKTLKAISKYIKKRKKQLFLYCKIYKQVEQVCDIEKQVDEYLKIFKVKKLNLVSIHSLDILKIDFLDAYKELKRLKDIGKIEHIGACNLDKNQLIELLNNGIDLFSFEGVYNIVCKYYETTEVIEICSKNNIKFIAYQPFVMGKLDFKNNDLLVNLSQKYNKTIEQVLLNYYIKHKGLYVLVKSTNSKHIVENAGYDFYIENEDYNKLDQLNKTKIFDVDFDGDGNKIYHLSYNEVKNGV